MAMRSHTVPKFLLDQFAYDESATASRRLWQYAKDRSPSGFASPKSATRIDLHFSDPTDADREKKVETRLNEEFENPVHRFLADLRYRTFVLSHHHARLLTRYVTLLFNRSDNRRKATRKQVSIAIDTTAAFIRSEEKLAKVAARWTFELIRLGYIREQPVTAQEVKRSAEKMIETMRTQEHQQTYVDSMERAMAYLDDALDNGQWNVMHTIAERPFVIGEAPVVTWQRLDDGTLVYGQGFATPDVEVILPVGSTACLHILPNVFRTHQIKQPSVREVNEAQASFTTKYCYACRRDTVLDDMLQPMFGQSKIGVNVFSVRHRNYDDTMFEIFMNGGSSFRTKR